MKTQENRSWKSESDKRKEAEMNTSEMRKDAKIPVCPQCNGKGSVLIGPSGEPNSRKPCDCQIPKGKQMREFETGATRGPTEGKLDYEGYLSPRTLRRYAEFMRSHQTQADGKKRDSDNWQKGIPSSAYMKSLWRHFMDLWTVHRGMGKIVCKDGYTSIEDALCAIIFNASGYLHELLKEESRTPTDFKDPAYLHELADFPEGE